NGDVSKYLTKDVKEVLELINKERAAVGAKPLALNENLCEVAQIRSKEIVTCWGHERPNGEPVNNFIRTSMQGKGIASENIGHNFETASEMMYFIDNRNIEEDKKAHGWMETWRAGMKHKDNILNLDYDLIGLAVYEDTSSGKVQKYWVADFYSTTVASANA
ncbi:MAG: hypothetical protein IKO27_07250, partial [Ruminococcus sp.]|nr:hypothetical protein [Ruminococcus sp.]